MADSSSAPTLELVLVPRVGLLFASFTDALLCVLKHGARSVYAPEMAEMQWYNSPLDKLIAPRLSQLTCCGADELPVREELLTEFILNSFVTGKYPDKFKKNALNLIRRVDHAALAYNAGRACLLDYLLDKRGKRVTAYFGAVSYFETHVAHLNLARWLAMRISRYPDRGDLYSEGSDCFDKRLQEIHNQAKHLHDKITEGSLPKGHTVSMWLTNTGLESVGWAVTFSELIEHLMDCYGVARWVTQELPKKIVANRDPETTE